MKHPSELAREYVFRAVSDDYESLEILRDQLKHWPPEYIAACTPERMTQALIALVNEGLVAPYLYNSQAQQYERSALSEDAIENLWFLITDEGKKALTSSP